MFPILEGEPVRLYDVGTQFIDLTIQVKNVAGLDLKETALTIAGGLLVLVTLWLTNLLTTQAAKLGWRGASRLAKLAWSLTAAAYRCVAPERSELCKTLLEGIAAEDVIAEGDRLVCERFEVLLPRDVGADRPVRFAGAVVSEEGCLSVFLTARERALVIARAAARKAEIDGAAERAAVARCVDRLRGKDGADERA